MGGSPICTAPPPARQGPICERSRRTSVSSLPASIAVNICVRPESPRDAPKRSTIARSARVLLRGAATGGQQRSGYEQRGALTRAGSVDLGNVADRPPADASGTDPRGVAAHFAAG